MTAPSQASLGLDKFLGRLWFWQSLLCVMGPGEFLKFEEFLEVEVASAFFGLRKVAGAGGSGVLAGGLGFLFDDLEPGVEGHALDAGSASLVHRT